VEQEIAQRTVAGASAPTTQRQRWFTAPMTYAIASVLAVVLVTVLSWPPRQDAQVVTALADELIGELDTFNVSGRSLDLEAHDPGKVLTWFKHKIAFHPSAPLVQAGPFHLQGARLCNLLNRRVASYMYDSGAHRASLYIVPGTVYSQRASGGGRYGCGFVSWHEDGLQYTLVGTAGLSNYRRWQVSYRWHSNGSPKTNSYAP
jgi:anti-sigma factor RsiW